MAYVNGGIGILKLRIAGETECRLLAGMNKELIEDEGSTNPMNVTELEERMRQFLLDGWAVELLEHDGEPVGYILYRTRQNERGQDELYIRQFFIRRENRGRGFGRAGIDLFMRERAEPGTIVVLDVLEVNGQGRLFWQAMGFLPYYTNMRRVCE